MTWQDHWEDEAERERIDYEAAPVEHLLQNISDGLYGRYYQVWDIVARRADPVSAAWILFDVLERDIDYLHRMPCAEALLKLLDCDRFRPVDLGGTHAEVTENLAALMVVIETKIGPRNV